MSIQIILTGSTVAEVKNDVLALASSLSGSVTTVAETPKTTTTASTPSGESPEDKAAAKKLADEKKAAEKKAADEKKVADKKAADEKAAADKAKTGSGDADANAAKLKALRELGMKFVTDQRSAELKELTAKFGIDKVSNAPVEKYDELLAAMTELYNNSAV